MRKSSLGQRLSYQPQRLSRSRSQDASQRASGIPRPGSRPSSGSREVNCPPKFPPLKRSKSQLSMTPARTPQSSLRPPGSASSARFNTPGSDVSVYTSSRPAQNKTMRDTRNLTDKTFVNREIQHITAFFHSRPNISNLLPKGLNFRSFMLKTFVDLVNYLVSCIDSTVCITMANYVEEIPFLMKKYGYPGNITASWLRTANTPHSLPHVVGLLSWLVTLVEAWDCFDVEDAPFPPDSDADEQQFPFGNSKIYFHQFIAQYHIWNSCDDQAAEKELDSFILDLCERNGLTDEELQQAADEVQTLRERVNDPNERAELEIIKDFLVKADLLRADLNKMVTYRNDNEQYVQSLEDKLGREKQALKDEEEALSRMEERISVLREQADRQLMTVEERNILLQVCDELKNQIRNKEECIAELQQEIFSDDLSLSRAREEITKKVQEYNKIVVTVSCSLPEVKDLLIETNIIHSEASRQLALQDEKAKQLCAVLQKRAQELEEKIRNAKSRNSEVKETCKKMSDEGAVLNETLRKREADILSFQKQMTMEGAKLKKVAAEIQADIQNILANSSKEEEELKESLQKALERKAKIEAHISQLAKKADLFFENVIKQNKDFKASIKTMEENHERRMNELVDKIEKKFTPP